MSWRKKYREQLKNAITDDEVNKILGTVYDEGFSDGYEDAHDDDDSLVHADPTPWEDLD